MSDVYKLSPEAVAAIRERNALKTAEAAKVEAERLAKLAEAEGRKTAKLAAEAAIRTLAEKAAETGEPVAVSVYANESGLSETAAKAALDKLAGEYGVPVSVFVVEIPRSGKVTEAGLIRYGVFESLVAEATGAKVATLNAITLNERAGTLNAEKSGGRESAEQKRDGELRLRVNKLAASALLADGKLLARIDKAFADAAEAVAAADKAEADKLAEAEAEAAKLAEAEKTEAPAA